MRVFYDGSSVLLGGYGGRTLSVALGKSGATVEQNYYQAIPCRYVLDFVFDQFLMTVALRVVCRGGLE